MTEFETIHERAAEKLAPIYGWIDNFPDLVNLVAEFAQRVLDDWRDDHGLDSWNRVPGDPRYKAKE